MPLTLYEMTIPPFIQGLKTLSAILEKGRLHDPANEASTLESRLVGDMGNLTFQIQRISDTAKALAVRVAKAEPVVMVDNEKTFPELQARIKRTIEVLEKLDPKCMDGMEDADVVLRTPGGETKFKGQSFVQSYSIPNFYFHLSMAYAILRKDGVPLGKRDYLGAA